MVLSRYYQGTIMVLLWYSTTARVFPRRCVGTARQWFLRIHGAFPACFAPPTPMEDERRSLGCDGVGSRLRRRERQMRLSIPDTKAPLEAKLKKGLKYKIRKLFA